MIYESFICDDYDMSKEELKEMVKLNNGVMRYDISSIGKFMLEANDENQLDVFDILCLDALCIAEGGNRSYTLHSFAANASYYESRFSDNNEHFVCVGIPSKNSSESYAAQITTFGAVLSNSELKDEAYQFIKLHADTKPWMHLDISVNRTVINETMEDLSSTYYEVYPSLGLIPQSIEMDMDDYGDSYQIKPMTEETKDYLLYMIDHIESANLPQAELSMIIIEEIENYLWGVTETIDDAYDEVLKRLEELGYTK